MIDAYKKREIWTQREESQGKVEAETEIRIMLP